MNIFPILGKIISHQRKWHNLVERKEKHRFQKLLYMYSPKGRNARGKSMNRWKDNSGNSLLQLEQTNQSKPSG